MPDEAQPHPQASDQRARHRAAFTFWTVVLSFYALASAECMANSLTDVLIGHVFVIPWAICLIICWFTTLIGAKYGYPHIGGVVAFALEIAAIPYGFMVVAFFLIGP